MARMRWLSFVGLMVSVMWATQSGVLADVDWTCGVVMGKYTCSWVHAPNSEKLCGSIPSAPTGTWASRCWTECDDYGLDNFLCEPESEHPTHNAGECVCLNEEEPTCTEDPCAYICVDGPCGVPNWETCECDLSESPIIIDLRGQEFELTSAAGGVMFDMNRDGIAERLAWTPAGVAEAFLALDRNGDGLINDGGELFGNFTDQPPSTEKNGFLALTVFDRANQGGNGDGQITQSDGVFSTLLLWVDHNHDGVSQRRELRRLAEHGVAGLSLDYRESRRTDEHGNQYRYRARIQVSSGPHRPPRQRWAIDVFLRVFTTS